MTDMHREGFERWYTEHFTFEGRCYIDAETLARREDGSYVKESTRDTWLGFQAALRYRDEQEKDNGDV